MAKTLLDCCEFIECNGADMFLTDSEATASRDRDRRVKVIESRGNHQLKKIPIKQKLPRRYFIGYSGGEI